MTSRLDAATARVAQTATSVQARATDLLDRLIAPRQRAELRQHIASWAFRHPNLTLLAALFLVFLGPPLTTFMLFTLATVLTFFSIAFLLATGATALVLGSIALFVLAPAVLLGTALALSTFLAISVTRMIVQHIRPGTSVAEVVTKAKGGLDGAADEVKARMPQTTAVLESENLSDDRPDPPSRSTSDREQLARQALGIPHTVPLTTSTEAAVAAAAERQRLQNERILSDEAGELASPDRMKLEEQIRLGEEIARQALEGKLGITVK